MKLFRKTLLLLFFALLATFAAATNNISQVQHVIVIIQENRTPDNLFHEDPALIAHAHVQPPGNQGPCNTTGQNIALFGTTLYTCWDPEHNHSQPTPSWTDMWDNGKMDGACNIQVNYPPPAGGVCPLTIPAYPQYTYVQNIAPDYILQPYFNVANLYGYGNYFFQTNQGPSFPAHQFLLSGTSAPVKNLDPGGNCTGPYPSEQCWKWFDAENAKIGGGLPYGCVAQSGALAWLIDPNSAESHYYTPPYPVNQEGFPCYTHDSLPTLLDHANPQITWRYYIREPYKTNGGYTLWNAPAAIDDICGSTQIGGTCKGGDYVDYVASVAPNQGKYTGDYAPILYDIEHCGLPNVSWVIPDGNWSDHASAGQPGDGGPSWVAAIVNAVGNNAACPGTGEKYWDDTVIFVVWDDWGGYYDDVPPPDCPGPGQCTGYTGGNGNGQQYVYGFRVPFLVVGAYARQGYISGRDVQPPITCPNYYCHDFGSILNFIEYAFGVGVTYGIGDPNYPYADYFVMDKNLPNYPYSLWDFFDFSTHNNFRPINGAKYPEDCFHHPKDSGCFKTYPMDPDDDANEND